MFIFLTLGLVVLGHLTQIAVAILVVSAVWGVSLLATARTAPQTDVTPEPEPVPAPVARPAVPRQFGERFGAGRGAGQRS